MKYQTFLKFPRSGFTLIELLVVLAIIAVLAGALASALRPDNPTVALQGAQAQLASIATQARGVAQWRGTKARLIINNNPDNPAHYLQFMGVVYEDPDNPGQWIPASKGTTLPRGAYFVPESPSTTSAVAPWPAERTSNSGATMNLQFPGNTTESFFFIEWNNRGVVTGNQRLALSTAVRGGTNGADVIFTNPENVRGLLIRRYGTFVMLNEAAAFGS